MEEVDIQIPVIKKAIRKMRLNRKCCVVCGAPPAGFTGYVYFASGRSRLYAPFCKEHLDTCRRFANPIFENEAALKLFFEKHPKEFAEDVRGKPLVFFTRIGYHSMTAR